MWRQNGTVGSHVSRRPGELDVGVGGGRRRGLDRGSRRPVVRLPQRYAPRQHLGSARSGPARRRRFPEAPVRNPERHSRGPGRDRPAGQIRLRQPRRPPAAGPQGCRTDRAAVPFRDLGHHLPRRPARAAGPAAQRPRPAWPDGARLPASAGQPRLAPQDAGLGHGHADRERTGPGHRLDRRHRRDRRPADPGTVHAGARRGPVGRPDPPRL